MSSKSFQHLILDLQKFWADWGCVVLQPYDTEVGAGTSSPETCLKALGPKPWKTAYVQPCRRPSDGRYGENPNRLQKYYQFQVLLKPEPSNAQELYLQSLEAIGLDTTKNDIRFVQDDWENPSLGATGLGWEVWCNGMEVTQFTYFQQICSLECTVVPVEITYGLERIAMLLQNVESCFDINWNGKEGPERWTYKDVCLLQEQEFSKYNFELADVNLLLKNFQDCEIECLRLLNEQVVLPAYEQCVKANHMFNLLNARGVISTTERAGYIARVRALAKACGQAWLNKNE